VSDFYETWEKLVRVVVLGRVFEVPENNILLRQLQYVSEDIGMGRYCWNGECRYCEIHFEKPGDETVYPGLACRVKGTDGMRLTKVATEIKYNMSEVLASAPRAEEPAGAPSSPSEAGD